MEKKKSNKGLIILLIILILMVLGLTSYIVYDKVLKEEPKVNEEKETSKEVVEKISQSELETIVENELYILNGKTSIEEITNEDKLTLVFDLLSKDSFTKEEVINTFNSLSIYKLGIANANYDCYSYDANEDIYTKNTLVQCKRGYYYTKLANKKVVSFVNKENKYTISIKYLWVNLSESGWDGNLYGSYNDMINSQNSLKTYSDIGVNVEEVTASYFNENYEEIKDKLDTYNYVFEKVDNKITLVDFYIN